MKNKVAVIILNWNSYKDCYDCLKSLEMLERVDYEVFLVDNDSNDDSYIRLQQDYDNRKFDLIIHFMKSETNIGFAGGNNIGINAAKILGFQYYWMLNADTEIDSRALYYMIEGINRDPSIGIVGSKIYYFGTNKIWFAGGNINTLFGTSSHIGQREEDHGQFNNTREVDYISGCSLLFKAEVLDDIGFMTEDYFLYYEESEWNVKAKQAGWLIKLIPDSIVYHKVSSSSGGEQNIAPYVAYYDLRNGYRMVRRTQISPMGWLFANVGLLNKILRYTVKIIVRRQDRKKERYWYVVKGVKDAIMNRMGKHPAYH
ncbi:hypothetical protein DFQ01_13453 [Paenibacillus cellulosilyticus]|uniref:Glycosyltransferase 2-like domain-containing protein n=1 Tax=Paenibacillus cellulosilyticus TaxID=375489 RepID=A0A2V2YUV4_9BACL|nr:glycosyltransferase family 2 protein [Paenibacillus cellulosilyticus]PWV93814.1 hypothetical protein DFQ01_13453 [Paenibacillus cellulosilyticus]QKS47429.1 glycosyltransferase family 2 protein [Paenibacillus cellulosilyticus]